MKLMAWLTLKFFLAPKYRQKIRASNVGETDSGGAIPNPGCVATSDLQIRFLRCIFYHFLYLFWFPQSQKILGNVKHMLIWNVKTWLWKHIKCRLFLFISSFFQSQKVAFCFLSDNHSKLFYIRRDVNKCHINDK